MRLHELPHSIGHRPRGGAQYHGLEDRVQQGLARCIRPRRAQYNECRERKHARRHKVLIGDGIRQHRDRSTDDKGGKTGEAQQQGIFFCREGVLDAANSALVLKYSDTPIESASAMTVEIPMTRTTPMGLEPLCVRTCHYREGADDSVDSTEDRRAQSRRHEIIWTHRKKILCPSTAKVVRQCVCVVSLFLFVYISFFASRMMALPSAAQLCDQFNTGLLVRNIEDLIDPTPRFPTRKSFQPVPWKHLNMNNWLDMAIIEYKNYSGPFFLPTSFVKKGMTNVYSDTIGPPANIGWVFSNHVMSTLACAVPIDPHTRWHNRLPMCSTATTNMSYYNHRLDCNQLHLMREFACCGRTVNDVLSIQGRILKHCGNIYNQFNVRWKTDDIIGVFVKGNRSQTLEALSLLRSTLPHLPLIELRKKECLPFV